MLIDRETCATNESVGKKMKEMIWRETIKVKKKKRKKKENNGSHFPFLLFQFYFLKIKFQYKKRKKHQPIIFGPLEWTTPTPFNLSINNFYLSFCKNKITKAIILMTKLIAYDDEALGVVNFVLLTTSSSSFHGMHAML